MTASTELQQIPLLGTLKLTSTIDVLTGLHIGGSRESLEIGGINSVIRDPISRHPYLPGSSIKGKLRSLVERLHNEPPNRQSRDMYRHECNHREAWYRKVGDTFVYHVGAKDCPVCRVFGSTGSKYYPQPDALAELEGSHHPALLKVRDSHLLPESINKLQQIDSDLYMTEWKSENNIDRITAAANPRNLERVAATSKFHMEMTYTVTDIQLARLDLQNLAIALKLLEDDALGGHGSRGYGKVAFIDIQLSYCDVERYRRMLDGLAAVETEDPTFADTTELLNSFQSVQQQLLPG